LNLGYHHVKDLGPGEIVFIKDDDIVQMKPDVYDYLDSEMELDKTNNDGEWKEVEKQDYTNTRINYQKYMVCQVQFL